MAIAIAIAISLDPDQYFRYGPESRSDWEHPTGAVALFCGLLAAEGAFVAWALRLAPGVRLWLRSMIGTLLFLPWALVSSAIVMHQPMFVIFHALWTWVCLLALGVAFVGSAGRALLRRVRA